jgi:hypothetical protein
VLVCPGKIVYNQHSLHSYPVVSYLLYIHQKVLYVQWNLITQIDRMHDRQPYVVSNSINYPILFYPHPYTITKDIGYRSLLWYNGYWALVVCGISQFDTRSDHVQDYEVDICNQN